MSESRTTTIWVKSGNTRIGKVIVNQKGSEEEAPYFYVGSSFEDAYETSATTYNYPAIESNDTSLKYVYYVTNMEGYSLDVVSGSDTINSAYIDDGQKHIVFVANVNQDAERYATLVIKSENNDTLATINITQKGKSEYYFYWGNTGTATSTATTAESEETTTTVIPYRTTYTNITYNIVDSWITSVTLNNNTFVAGFSTNQGESDRTGTVQIKSGNDVVGTITITQKKPSVVYSIEVYPYNGSAGSTAQTSTTVTVTSINQGWEYQNEGTNITAQPSMGNEGSTEVTLTFPAYNGTRTVSFVGDEYGQATFTYTQSTPTPPTPRISCTWEGTSTYTATTTQGNDLQAKASLNGSDVTNSVTWTSEDNSIATVSNTGLVTAVGPGTVKIYASMAGATSDYVQLTVENEPTPDELTITISTTTIGTGATAQTRAFLNGEEITTGHPTLVFSSDDTSVATISNDTRDKGKITGVATGTTDISATYGSLTSNSITVTVTGSSIDPYDPANWAWYDVRIVTGSTSAQTAVTESIHINESSELIAIAYVTSLGKTIDVTSGSEFSFRSGDNTGTISNGYFTATNAGTAEIISTYQYQGGTPVTSQSYVTINVQAAARNLYLSVEPVGGTILQTGVTETISFVALLLDHDDPSYEEDVTSQCLRWYISSGTTYAETGTTKGDIKLKTSPTSKVVGEVTAIYIIGSSATANFTILPPAAPTDELTAITVTIESAPDIPASGGRVTCDDINYTVLAYYKIAPPKEVNAQIECGPVSASSKQDSISDRAVAGTLTLSASYTEDGITKAAITSTTIYQEANNVVREWTETGKAEETPHNETVTGDSTYSISCSEDETVDYQSGATQINVYPFKHISMSEIKYDTYKETTTPYTSYTSTYIKTGQTTTGTSILSGETTVIREWTENIMTVFNANPNYPNWINNVVCSQGTQVLGHGTADISYSEYSSGSDNRIGTIVFYIVEDTATTCTFNLTQTPSPTPPTPTRNITVEPVGNMSVEHSSNPAAEGSTANFYFRGVGNTDSGTIYFRCGQVSAGTVNSYTKSGSITFYNVETGATTVTLEISALDFGYNGHFYGASGDFEQINVYVDGSGTAIETGDKTITLDVPAGTTDDTINLICNGNPTMVYDY